MSDYIDRSYRQDKYKRYNYLGMPMGDAGQWVDYQLLRYGIRFATVDSAMSAYYADKRKYEGTRSDVIWGSDIKPASRRSGYNYNKSSKFNRRRYW